MNTKIKYNESLIEIEAGKSKAIKCKDKKMTDDVIITAGKPEGTIDITDNGTYDVTEYASANIDMKISATDDGSGNVTLSFGTATDDEEGNVNL
jgi:hypothetical protein